MQTQTIVLLNETRAQLPRRVFLTQLISNIIVLKWLHFINVVFLIISKHFFTLWYFYAKVCRLKYFFYVAINSCVKSDKKSRNSHG